MSWATAVAAVMVLAMTVYACTGLADHGAGFWDLVAGGRERGREPRALIDAAITPVWEANHVWLIFVLVLCWTAFGSTFASVMSTLFIPLALAVLGIVLRAASFAMRKDARRRRMRHLAGWVFGVGSVLTPFCLGTALGAVLSGRVPPGNTAGDELTSWWNPTSVLVGLLTVAIAAFVSGVYLLAEATRRGVPRLHDYFRRRALVAGSTAFVLSLLTLAVLRADAKEMFERLVGRSWILLALGVLALAAAFLLATRRVVRRLRLIAAAGIGALVWAWAVAQYPYLLPFSLTVDDGAAATVTLRWTVVWFTVALLLVGPALTLLYLLDQRGGLGEDPTTSRPGHEMALADPPPAEPRR